MAEPITKDPAGTSTVAGTTAVRSASPLTIRPPGTRARALTSAERGCYKCDSPAVPPNPSRKESHSHMTPEDLARLGGLLLGQRLVALGVVADGEPIVGLLPYAVADDRTALLVQSSGLARHSRGLA